jgi:hypothetical protein
MWANQTEQEQRKAAMAHGLVLHKPSLWGAAAMQALQHTGCSNQANKSKAAGVSCWHELS